VFSLTFRTDNAAFEDAPEEEAASILTAITRALRSGDQDGIIRDANGNQIGYWAIDDTV